MDTVAANNPLSIPCGSLSIFCSVVLLENAENLCAIRRFFGERCDSACECEETIHLPVREIVRSAAELRRSAVTSKSSEHCMTIARLFLPV